MEPLIRSADFTMEQSDGQTLEGYAAVFDTPTVINSWEGHFVEVIERGAFARTVRSNPKPVLQFDHGTHPLMGSLPIGTVEQLREDAQGLYVRARLHDNWLIEPVRDAIREGSITGMSFKFTVPEGGVSVDRGADNLPVHTLTDLDLHELGPVVWPAYKETSVGVRSAELASILAGDETARRDVAAGLIFGIPADPGTATVARQASDADFKNAYLNQGPTGTKTSTVRTDEEEPTVEPEGSSVRTDEEEPTVATTSRAHRKRLAQITRARYDRAIHQFEEREMKTWS